jgi:hypothetical protein
MFIVFSTASYRESAVQIHQKMFYGLHVKYPSVLNLRNWICYYVGNTRRFPEILKGSSIIGRIDKAGSLSKVPLMTDHSKQNIQLLQEMFAPSQIWKVHESVYTGSQEFSKKYVGFQVTCP